MRDEGLCSEQSTFGLPWGGSLFNETICLEEGERRMVDAVNTYRFVRRALILAGLLGAVGVILGAYSAHGLEKHLETRGLSPEVILQRLQTMETGVRYHLFHVLALVGWSAVAGYANVKWLRVALGLLLVGMLVFSGSLYLLVALDAPKLGAVTPLGGVALILGWCLASLAVFRGPD